jgi:hypothetical protein
LNKPDILIKPDIAPGQVRQPRIPLCRLCRGAPPPLTGTGGVRELPGRAPACLGIERYHAAVRLLHQKHEGERRGQHAESECEKGREHRGAGRLRLDEIADAGDQHDEQREPAELYGMEISGRDESDRRRRAEDSAAGRSATGRMPLRADRSASSSSEVCAVMMVALTGPFLAGGGMDPPQDGGKRVAQRAGLTRSAGFPT